MMGKAPVAFKLGPQGYEERKGASGFWAKGIAHIKTLLGWDSVCSRRMKEASGLGVW